jgi:hypothetical protein
MKNRLRKDGRSRMMDGMMLSFEDFTRILNEEVKALPEYVHEKLNGGVLADSSVYLHPGRVADDLYIFGTYSADPVFGKQIVLYYGSFAAVLGDSSESAYREKIRETVRHEFLHHLETRAGLYSKGTLAEEDALKMQEYYNAHAADRLS